MEKCKPSRKIKTLTIGYMFLILITSLSPYDFTYTFDTKPVIQNLLHIPVFSILAVLLLEFLQYYQLIKIKLIMYVLFISFAFGLLNEIIQSFVPNRFMGGMDIVLDIIGVIGGIVFYFLIEKIKPGLVRKVVCE